MPESVPSGPSVRPPGSAPDEIAKAYGGVPAVAASFCEYGVPTVAPGSMDPVAIANPAGLTVSVNAFETGAPPLSAKVSVKPYEPAAVGVPESEVVSNDKPGGAFPEEVVNAKPVPVPPIATKAAEYDTPTVAVGSVAAVVIVIGDGLITSVNGLLTLPDALSVTLTVKLYVPAGVGDPLITPPLPIPTPDGRQQPASAKA